MFAQNFLTLFFAIGSINKNHWGVLLWNMFPKKLIGKFSGYFVTCKGSFIYLIIIKLHRGFVLVGFYASDIVRFLWGQILDQGHHWVFEQGSSCKRSFRCFGDVHWPLGPHFFHCGVAWVVQQALEVLEECVFVLVQKAVDIVHYFTSVMTKNKKKLYNPPIPKNIS